MRMPFAYRFVAVIVVVEILLLGLLVWNGIRLTDQGHRELMESTVRQQSALLAAAVAPGLIAYDHAMVQDVLTILNDRYDLVHAEVLDHHGDRVAAIGDMAHASRAGPDVYQEIPERGLIEVTRKVTVAGQDSGYLHLAYSTAATRKIIEKVRWQNTAIALLAVVVLVVITLFTGYFLTRKLGQLRKGVEEIQSGNLGHQVAMSSDDEFGSLARAFNQMAGHLARTQGQLEAERSELVRKTSHLHSLMNSVDAVIWEAESTAARICFVSDEACDMLGYPREQWMKEGFLLRHVHDDDFSGLSSALKALREEGAQVSLDVRLLKVNGKPAWVRLIAHTEFDAGEGRAMIRGLIIDVSDEKQHEEEIIYLADHDPMTGLINRRQFQQRLEHHIGYGKRYNHASSLMFIDIDHFKYINDTFGHQAGDAYLVEVARCLKSTLRETDILGRLGGDEFGLILPFTPPKEAGEVAENLLKTLSAKHWMLEGEPVHISASIGITALPDGRKVPSQLLAEADAAMYTAKSSGGNSYHVYQKGDSGIMRMQSKVRIENLIHDAFANERFVLHYQPIIDLDSGAVSHHEALVRILGEDGNLIYPATFISTAESFGLIRNIDRMVVERVIRAVFDSFEADKPRTIAFNLSGSHIDDSKFQAWIQDLLIENWRVAPHLIIEVTETAAVENLVSATEFMQKMRKLGCRFALDDFGVGFASFHYIKALPVSYIKIDGSFVRNLHVDEADGVFVKATVDIARRLGITTIAEYVENEHIAELLREVGVDLGQGFHLGRPAAEFADEPGATSTVIPWEGGKNRPRQ